MSHNSLTLSRPYDQLPSPDEGTVYIQETFDGQRYVSTGLFPPGARRKIENLKRVTCLVLDMDVKDWLGHTTPDLSRDKASQAVHEATAEEIDAWVEALLKDFALAWVRTVPEGWLPTAVVCSGAGIHVYCWLKDDQGRSEADIKLARLANKALVKRLNAAAGYQMADRAAVDCGTRILRPVGTQHTKNPDRPLPVRFWEDMRPDERFDLEVLGKVWSLAVSTRIIPKTTLKDRLDMGSGSPDDDLIDRLFGSRIAALREMVASDPFFQWCWKNPEKVSYPMRRMQATNLLAAASGRDDDAWTVFWELCRLLPERGEPTNKRFNESLMRQRFGEAKESLKSHGPLTYGTLREQVEDAVWEEIFPPGKPRLTEGGSPAGELARSAQGKKPADSKKGRQRRATQAYQTGRIESETQIEGEGFSGTIGDWVTQAQISGETKLKVACPFFDDPDYCAQLALHPDGAVYLYCQNHAHAHVSDGRVGWYVDLSETWEASIEVTIRLRRSQSGHPRTGVFNAVTILERDPRLHEQYWYDEFRKALMVGDRPVLDSDVGELRNRIEAVYNVDFGKDTMWTALEVVGKRYARNPAVDLFRSYVSHGPSVVEEFLIKGLGAPDTPLNRAYSARWLTGLAARVLEPGCKMDTVLVLVGPQGIGKSTALRLLVGTDWFSDTPIDLRNKDAYQQIHEVIVYEFAELKGIASAKVTQETIKAFFSSLVDRFRPPYKRTIETHPRHTVFVATSNKPDVLADPTGSRRFWAAECVGTPDRHTWLMANREQLLAEAVWRYDQWLAVTEGGQARLQHRGEEFQWWLTEEEDAWREEAAEAFEQEDSRAQAVYEWAACQTDPFTLDELLTDLMGLKIEEQDRRLQTDISAILRGLGWDRKQRRRHGRRQWFWIAPEDVTVPLKPPIPKPPGGEYPAGLQDTPWQKQ